MLYSPAAFNDIVRARASSLALNGHLSKQTTFPLSVLDGPLQVRSFCTEPECLRVGLLRPFETFTAEMCRGCQFSNSDVHTYVLQVEPVFAAAFSIVSDCGVAASLLTRVLSGSKGKEITSRQLQKLDGYGVADLFKPKMTQADIDRVVHRMLVLHLLTVFTVTIRNEKANGRQRILLKYGDVAIRDLPDTCMKFTKMYVRKQNC
jgi:superfamily II DNA helicase RecQ